MGCGTSKTTAIPLSPGPTTPELAEKRNKNNNNNIKTPVAPAPGPKQPEVSPKEEVKQEGAPPAQPKSRVVKRVTISDNLVSQSPIDTKQFLDLLTYEEAAKQVIVLRFPLKHPSFHQHSSPTEL